MISETISRFFLRLVHALFYASLPLVTFVFGRAGKLYGLGPLPKLRLLFQLLRNSRMPRSASAFLEHVVLADALLSVPSDWEGHVAEFGCYRGGSTASLSLVCALTNRRLIVFDSFSGLPDPSCVTYTIANGMALSYKRGDFSSSLEEVKRNVTQFGSIDVCEFVPGYFIDTLPTRGAHERYVLVFEDADLPSSVRTVLEYTWPRLQLACKFFTHEARDLEVVGIFFDNEWWKKKLRVPAPGLVGSGLGLPLARNGSCLGYIVKNVPCSQRR